MNYVTSDIHFNHKGILALANRPFATTGEMTGAVIGYWRARVTDRDDVYVVGDFGFAFHKDGDRIEDIFAALPGRKHLIIGNHDESNPAVLKLPWTSQQHYLKLRDNGRRAILCHYPLETWDGAHRGYIHLHGHSHGTLKRVINHRFDVGVDVQGYAPVPLAEFFARADEQVGYKPADHHGAEL